MYSSIVESMLIVFGLTIGLLSIFNLVDKNLARDILTILSILLPLIYSCRRRRELGRFKGLFNKRSD